MTGMAVAATVSMGVAAFAASGPAVATTSTVSFNNFCTASSVLTVTKLVATGVTIDAPDTVQPGQQFTYRVQPNAGSYPNSDSGATTTNISRLKVDYAVPANATFVSAAVVPGTAIGLDNVAPDVQRLNDTGSPDAAGSVIRLSGANQVIGNGTANSTNSEGGIRVPKSKKNLDGTTNANGDTWYRLPAVDITVTAGASGTIEPSVRVAGAAGNNNANENWSTQLAKATFIGSTQWAPTKCSPRENASAGLNAGGGPLATINIGSSTPVDQDTTTTLNVPATAETGASVNLSATVAPNPGGGTVQFKDNGADIGTPVDATSGTATLPQTFNTAGAHQITAVFSGATGFKTSTSAASTITVSNPTPVDQDTTTTLNVPGTAETGASVNLTATVAPNPNGGTVQFKADGTDIGTPVTVTGGTASLAHTFNAAGAHQITAVFSGATGFKTSTSAASTVTVSDPAPTDQDTTTTLNVPATAETGASVNLSATVAPNPNGGTVQFKADGTDIGTPVTVTAGTASLAHTFNAAGAHQITAVFSGATGFTGSTSAASTIAVSDPAPTDQDTTTTLTAPSTATSGTAVNLTATVAPNPNGGTVQFKKNGTDIGTPVAINGGAATLSYTFTDAGAQQITAEFSGATGFKTSASAASTITVSDPTPTDQDTTTTLTVPATATSGTAVDLKAVVAPNPGGGTVQFKDNGTAIGAPVTVVNGQATLSHTFTDNGDHHITAEFSGSAGFTGSVATPATVTVGGGDGGTTSTTSTTTTTTTTTPGGNNGGSLANIFGS